MAKVGAPKGGRVHWLIFNLSSYVCRNYWRFYDYPTHDYLICRRCHHLSWRTFNFMDIFIIKSPSRKCWRVMAFNMDTAQTVYRTFRKSSEVADFIDELASEWHGGREWTEDREYIENRIKNQK